MTKDDEWEDKASIDADEEEDDIAWEEYEDGNGDETAAKPKEGPYDYNEEDFSTSTKKTNKGTKRRRSVRYNNSDRELVRDRLKEDTICGILHSMMCSRACDSQTLQACMLSLLPMNLLDMSPNLVNVRSIMAFVKSHFKALPDKALSLDEGLEGSDAKFLLDNVFTNRGGGSQHVNQLLVCLLRALGLEVRYISCISTRSLSPNDHADIKRRKLNDKTETVDDDISVESGSHRIIIKSWCEVHLPVNNQSVSTTANSIDNDDECVLIESKQYRWICIDISSNTIDEYGYKLMEKQLKVSKNQMIFVVGIEADGFIANLTPKYLSKYNIVSSTLKKLEVDGWIDSVINDILISNNTALSADNRSILNINRRKEREEMAQHHRNIPEPKSFVEYKDHPIYLLERYLKANEVINPLNNKPVKLFRGEAVYLQSQKEILRSKHQWTRSLRQIKLQEKDKPVKTTTRRLLTPTDDGQDKIEVKLYGHWQTETLIVPEVIDDILPVNEYGNIEIWDGFQGLVPKGSVLIESEDVNSLIKAGKFLDLPYAPAIFGFDKNSGGYGIPRIGGVVVLPQHEQAIRDAAENIFGDKMDKAEKKRENIIVRRWERLTRSLISRRELRSKYGH